jgi:uncharacterized damage-inducible protein DinB
MKLDDAAALAALREHLLRLLDWQDAHATFEAAVENIPSDKRGVRPEGLPHSAWELVEHIRLAQHDILDFCRNPDYKEMAWPDDYWPRTPAPPDAHDWQRSIAAYRSDLDALKQLCADASTDLFARIPHGTGQTYLREILLVADHNAYHVGQLVLVRRQLGIWNS